MESQIIKTKIIKLILIKTNNKLCDRIDYVSLSFRKHCGIIFIISVTSLLKEIIINFQEKSKSLFELKVILEV